MTRDPYRYFRVEARELLEQLGKGVLELEKAGKSGSSETMTVLLRAAHTLKGAARVVKQREIAEASHALEDLFVGVRDQTLALDAGVERMLSSIDAMSTQLASLTAVQPVAPPSAAGVVAEPAPVEAPVLRADIADMDALFAGISQLHVQLIELRRGTNHVTRARQLATVLSDKLWASRPEPRLAAIAEDLRRELGQLEAGLKHGDEQLERELSEVRGAAERLRLLPVSSLFLGLERVARDAARTLGKQLRFETSAFDVRMDTQVLDTINPALVQLVRNAVAHGIESAPERVAAGKPAAGLVRIAVIRRGTRVAFVCEDDGRGVDLAAVRVAAERAGLAAEHVGEPGSVQLLELLMRVGISTSAEVTGVSGRGVGLDVVRSAVAKLGGEVSVQTHAGKGARFELRVPASLSAFDALLVEAQGVTAAIPLDAVRKTQRLLPSDVTRGANGWSVLYDGKVIPFTPLARHIAPTGFVATRAPRMWSAVVLQVGTLAAAVGVDRLLGTESIVQRPLPRHAPRVPMVAGAMLDGQGTLRVLLDAEALVQASAAPDTLPLTASEAPLPILVIDDSLTTRMLEKSILESAGYVVEVAISGEDGLEKAKRGKHALFLVDVEMPGIDGFTFVERTRADPELRKTPAILVTSRNAPEDKQRGSDAGASDYMVKSEFDQAELLRRIRELVRSS